MYYYITTPIYYVNDSPHIGHAYTTIACDIIARFKRLDGFTVKFLTGTDEHGQKIEQAAKNNNIAANLFVEKLIPSFQELIKLMNISNDDFIRTTELRHKNTVLNMWNQMMSNGNIYLDKYIGWYAISDEAFYKEEELLEGKAPTGATVQWIEEPSYFFKLSKWQDKLLQFYDENPDFIQPTTRRNEVISFVKRGLHDISISRTNFSWGISVPNNSRHIIYVWLDALFNYISSLNENELNYWPCDLHIIGKDILYFHAVYWPAFLLSVNLAPPKRIFAHGWWTNEGKKISKSLGNTIKPDELVQKLRMLCPEAFVEDYIRYFLFREISFGNDGNYSFTNLVTRVNTELVNNIGNLIQRVLILIHKKCNSKIPEASSFNSDDNKLLASAYNSIHIIRKHINNQKLGEALVAILELSDNANIYINKETPWSNTVERVNTVLYVLSECIRVIGILLQPFLPKSAYQILLNLNIINNESYISFDKIEHGIMANTLILKSEIIFPRINNV